MITWLRSIATERGGWLARAWRRSRPSFDEQLRNAIGALDAAQPLAAAPLPEPRRNPARARVDVRL